MTTTRRCPIKVEVISHDGIELTLQCQENGGHSGLCAIPIPFDLEGNQSTDYRDLGKFIEGARLP